MSAGPAEPEGDAPASGRAADPGPFRIGPRAARAPRLETLASELASSRHYLLRATRGLDADALRVSPKPAVNAIGALLCHIAAAERMFQRLTGQGTGFLEEDADFARAFRFEGDPLRGESIDAYVAHLADVRGTTMALFSSRGDGWLDEPRTFAGHPSNNHYYWLHLLMDEARHTGQIILARKYFLPEADADFDPYALR